MNETLNETDISIVNIELLNISTQCFEFEFLKRKYTSFLHEL